MRARGLAFIRWGLVYAKTLIPGPNAVPALMATTDDADILLPQLLDRGWALFGEPLPTAGEGRLVVGADRLQLVVDDQALLDDLNPYAPDGWCFRSNRTRSNDGVGQSRKDRRYATPRTTRHVWLQPDHPGIAPVQGYVLEWRRHSYHWTALVLVSGADGEGRPTATQLWVPAERLTPVRSDPNNGGRVRFLG